MNICFHLCRLNDPLQRLRFFIENYHATQRSVREPHSCLFLNSARVLQTIQMKLILLWVWAEPAVLGRAKTALKFKYEI